jgi:spermidine/putrescine transport system substrate-binding protein
MTLPPRDGRPVPPTTWPSFRRHRDLSRRDFTRLLGLVTVGSPLIAGPLAGCGGSGGGSDAAASLPIASPEQPVTLPVPDDEQPIESGLPPEENATLKIYNYADYMDPAAFDSFEEKFADANVTIELSTFNDYPEALAKIRSGEVDFDVFVVVPDTLPRVVAAGLGRPLNHDYIPNIANVWPEFSDPFYDQGWQYTVPYTTYTTGIAWRTDMIDEDIAARENPWDVFWDPQYAGMMTVLDDYRETIGAALLRRGETDLQTADQALLDQAQKDLLEMTDLTAPRVTINYYSELPEGQHGLSMAWSGDAVNFQYYLPEDGDPGVFRYWFPGQGRGRVDNDMVMILRSGKNPVLAHEFLNHLLDTDVAIGNFGATGYQPPQRSITPSDLVAQGYVPENLSSAVVLQEYFEDGLRLLALPPEVDAQWQAVWQRFKAGS